MSAAFQSSHRTFHKNLEALRGIAALLVVLHHLSLNQVSALAAIPLLRQGWLFVDLFFVLSGYVIASAHAESEPTADAARRFLIRRFFRLWPLHFATLVAALVVDVAAGKSQQTGYGLMVALNITLAHAWGLTSGAVLNGPSWSISTEWAAYLLFAWICLVTPSRSRRLLLLGAFGLLSFATLIVWRDASLDGDLALRVPRCLMSFALGAGVWAWCRYRQPMSVVRATVIQLTCASAMVGLLAFVASHSRGTMLMPPISAVLVGAMVLDPGSAVRRLLGRPTPQWFGRCSYSIYLVHMPLFGLLVLATPGGWPKQPMWANAWAFASLCVLLAVSSLTNRLIEKPFRDYGRRIAQGSGAGKVGSGAMETTA